MYKLPADYYETYLQRLAAVTVDDVSRVAKKYLVPNKARIVVVGNKDEVMNKLTAFDKEDGKIQLYDIYANPRKDESGAPVDINANDLVEKYLTALGGRQKLDAVKSLDQTYTFETMGMSITSRMVQDAGKFYMKMSAQGADIMSQKYDGEKGIVEQMGQQMPLEGEDLASMKEQAMMFPERNYKTAGYTMEVKGMEDVNGKACYKLVVTKPSGAKSTEYYDKESHLKIKEVQTDGTQSQTFEYADYKSIDGISVPHTVTISGQMPQPIVMIATEIIINSAVDPALFKI
jgi:hypothetical protein